MRRWRSSRSPASANSRSSAGSQICKAFNRRCEGKSLKRLSTRAEAQSASSQSSAATALAMSRRMVSVSTSTEGILSAERNSWHACARVSSSSIWPSANPTGAVAFSKGLRIARTCGSNCVHFNTRRWRIPMTSTTREEDASLYLFCFEEGVADMILHSVPMPEAWEEWAAREHAARGVCWGV